MAKMRAYFKLDLYFFEHPKVVDLSPEAIVLFIASIGYANRLETDGFVPRQMPGRLVGVSDTGTSAALLAAELVTAVLWHQAGDPCPRGHDETCPKLDGDGWRIHDFLEHNPSKEERERQRAETRERYMPPALRLAVMARDGYRCRTCGTTESLTIDHVHPFSLGGPTTLDNLQTLCRSHNSSKGARL